MPDLLDPHLVHLAGVVSLMQPVYVVEAVQRVTHQKYELVGHYERDIQKQRVLQFILFSPGVVVFSLKEAPFNFVPVQICDYVIQPLF